MTLLTQMKNWLIPDWQKAWTYLSVQIAVVLAALNGLQLFLPAMKEVMSPTTFTVVNAFLGLAIAICRVLQQPIFGTPSDSSK